jgi:hypothetical protein
MQPSVVGLGGEDEEDGPVEGDNVLAHVVLAQTCGTSVIVENTFFTFFYFFYKKVIKSYKKLKKVEKKSKKSTKKVKKV